MVQQGQVFKLRTRSADGTAGWAYRYRLEGRGSARPQVGGFASRIEVHRLTTELRRIGRTRSRHDDSFPASDQPSVKPR